MSPCYGVAARELYTARAVPRSLESAGLRGGKRTKRRFYLPSAGQGATARRGTTVGGAREQRQGDPGCVRMCAGKDGSPLDISVSREWLTPMRLRESETIESEPRPLSPPPPRKSDWKREHEVSGRKRREGEKLKTQWAFWPKSYASKLYGRWDAHETLPSGPHPPHVIWKHATRWDTRPAQVYPPTCRQVEQKRKLVFWAKIGGEVNSTFAGKLL